MVSNTSSCSLHDPAVHPLQSFLESSSQKPMADDEGQQQLIGMHCEPMDNLAALMHLHGKSADQSSFA